MQVLRLRVRHALRQQHHQRLLQALLQARGVPAAAKEHGKAERTVLIEFDSLAAALGAYDSPGYKAALVALGENAVVRDIRIIEGV